MHAWECIVVDGFSDNGSWEYLYDVAQNNSKFRLYQKPRKGIYNAWNEGVKLAKGDFVYIATSDDTMHPDFFSRMWATLNEHKSCDLAHCCLQIINQAGFPEAGVTWDKFLAAQYFGELMTKVHIRHAPHDGILHAFIKTVYHSITQVLIRKKVFDDVGLFLEDGTIIADYEWGMRATLVKNTIHVPEYLATWRLHPTQATRNDTQLDPKTYERLIDWISLNLNKLKMEFPSEFMPFKINDLTAVYRQNAKYFTSQQLRKQNVILYKLYNMISLNRLQYTDGVEEAKEYFNKLDLNRLVQVIQ